MNLPIAKKIYFQLKYPKMHINKTSIVKLLTYDEPSNQSIRIQKTNMRNQISAEKGKNINYYRIGYFCDN